MRHECFEEGPKFVTVKIGVIHDDHVTSGLKMAWAAFEQCIEIVGFGFHPRIETEVHARRHERRGAGDARRIDDHQRVHSMDLPAEHLSVSHVRFDRPFPLSLAEIAGGSPAAVGGVSERPSGESGLEEIAFPEKGVAITGFRVEKDLVA